MNEVISRCCVICKKFKETPLKNKYDETDWLGGYICLSCIENALIVHHNISVIKAECASNEEKRKKDELRNEGKENNMELKSTDMCSCGQTAGYHSKSDLICPEYLHLSPDELKDPKYRFRLIDPRDIRDIREVFSQIREQMIEEVKEMRKGKFGLDVPCEATSKDYVSDLEEGCGDEYLLKDDEILENDQVEGAAIKEMGKEKVKYLKKKVDEFYNKIHRKPYKEDSSSQPYEESDFQKLYAKIDRESTETAEEAEALYNKGDETIEAPKKDEKYWQEDREFMLLVMLQLVGLDKPFKNADDAVANMNFELLGKCRKNKLDTVETIKVMTNAIKLAQDKMANDKGENTESTETNGKIQRNCFNCSNHKSPYSCPFCYDLSEWYPTKESQGKVKYCGVCCEGCKDGECDSNFNWRNCKGPYSNEQEIPIEIRQDKSEWTCIYCHSKNKWNHASCSKCLMEKLKINQKSLREIQSKLDDFIQSEDGRKAKEECKSLTFENSTKNDMMVIIMGLYDQLEKFVTEKRLKNHSIPTNIFRKTECIAKVTRIDSEWVHLEVIDKYNECESYLARESHNLFKTPPKVGDEFVIINIFGATK